MRDVINRLIASGKAVSGHFVGGTGGVSRIFAPPGKGLIITRIELSAFSDIPDTATFADGDIVAEYAWHQLAVFSQQGTQIFNARHDLSVMVIGGAFFTIPTGRHIFDVWINARNYCFFSLTHAPAPIANWVSNIDRVPPDQDIPEPPFNYGVSPGGQTTVTNQIFDAVNGFEGRGMGIITPEVAAVSFPQLQWPTNIDSRLNPPIYTIPFGAYSAPVLNIDYIIVAGNPDETFRGAI
jgi:hypothetical protein